MDDLANIHLESRFFNYFSKINETSQFLTEVKPDSVVYPQLVGWSRSLAAELLIRNPVSELDYRQYGHILSGHQLLAGSIPLATRYGGHQFGHWAGQLGDGRAILLGERQDKQKKLQELQLKGSGQTPYSRRGDGKAVLRSSLREFLCSEAMHHLGIPTTRALSLTLTGEKVVRDILYTGHPQQEQGAVVCRTSPTFIRFGHFEILNAAKQFKELKQLTDYVIENYYPDLIAINKTKEDLYSDFLKEVSIKTAQLIAAWMSVGFVHGVMNTDNMSILGLTIDYGPYGWLDNFDFHFTPNTTDNAEKRYRYSQQPAVALWNLNCLAHALYPLVQDRKKIEESLQVFQMEYETCFLNNMSNKLGVMISKDQKDLDWISQLFEVMHESSCDFTLFFRLISEKDLSSLQDRESLRSIFYSKEITDAVQSKWNKWFGFYFQKMSIDDSKRDQMKDVNPSIVFRNYLAQNCIEEVERGNYQKIEEILNCFEFPFKSYSSQHDLTQMRPDWAKDKVGCSQLSCSS